MYRKKVVILYGSPHLVGSTFRLLHQFKQVLEQSDQYEYDIEQFNLFDLNLKACNDCGVCQYGLCHMNHLDGYSTIINELQTVDITVIATPVYFGGYPAPVKTFIDRMQQFYVNDFHGKKQSFLRRTKGVLLGVSGKPHNIVKQGMCHTAQMFFNCMNAGFVGNLFYETTDDSQDFEADFTLLMQSLSLS